MIYLFSKNILSNLILYWLSIDIWLTTVKKIYIWFTSKSISTFMFILFSLPQMQSARMYAFKLRVLIWLKIILNNKDFRSFSVNASFRSLLSWIEASVTCSQTLLYLWTTLVFQIVQINFNNLQLLLVFILFLVLIFAFIFILISVPVVSAVFSYIQELFIVKVHFILFTSDSISFHI